LIPLGPKFFSALGASFVGSLFAVSIAVVPGIKRAGSD
jgi:hypothetical protein